jgi:uncharacterized damage-inducible protein DinB
MKIESPSFTRTDVERFLIETVEQERLHTIERLERASTRLAEALSRSFRSGEGADGQGWSRHDVLAHIVVLSKFYGMLVKKVGTGELQEVDLLANAQARDPAAEPLKELPAEQLVALAQRDHKRTIEYLRSATPQDLLRRTRLLDGLTMSSLEIAVLPLCSHLENHLDQMERA